MRTRTIKADHFCFRSTLTQPFVLIRPIIFGLFRLSTHMLLDENYYSLYNRFQSVMGHCFLCPKQACHIRPRLLASQALSTSVVSASAIKPKASANVLFPFPLGHQALNAHNFSLLVLSNFDKPTWPPSCPMVGSLRVFLFCSPCSAPLTSSPFDCPLCWFLPVTRSARSPRRHSRNMTSLLLYPKIFRG